MKIRGGIRIGELWESWPSAQLCFAPEQILLRYRGDHAIEKKEVKVISYLRGSFTSEIRIEQGSDVADSPIRFFPLFSKDSFSYVQSSGYPCEERKAPFYTKGDLIT